MARSKVVLNHVGMGELLKSDAVRDMLTRRAQPVLAAAKADPHDDTGAYENGLQIQQHTTPSRATVRVVATDWKGHILEARYGILSRALDAAGGEGGGDPNELVDYTTKAGKKRKATRAQVAHWTGGV